jgi:hypothetical protein
MPITSIYRGAKMSATAQKQRIEKNDQVRRFDKGRLLFADDVWFDPKRGIEIVTTLDPSNGTYERFPSSELRRVIFPAVMPPRPR